MKILRFLDAKGQTGYATLSGDAAYKLEGEMFGKFTLSNEVVENYKVLAPIVPTFIIGIGLNYKHHAEESGAAIPEYPIVFTKFPSSVQNPFDPISLPAKLPSQEVDYECELAVVIGKSCRNATKYNALSYVYGYTAANDVSARDWQIKYGGSQWGRGKAFDTFCPLGPVLVTADEIPNPNDLPIKTTLNGETVQDWNTVDMIFGVRTLIEFLSADTTLPPGTVILTGTPHGVGMASSPPRYLKAGDFVTVEIEGIGALTNPVQSSI